MSVDLEGTLIDSILNGYQFRPYVESFLSNMQHYFDKIVATSDVDEENATLALQVLGVENPGYNSLWRDGQDLKSTRMEELGDFVVHLEDSDGLSTPDFQHMDSHGIKYAIVPPWNGSMQDEALYKAEQEIYLHLHRR